jgi:asparagine synthase (glutamine-hydrolysing)
VTADARLDNRDELLPALGLPPFFDLPDSSLILKAYQQWGTACVEHMVGEFAFAIWDARARRLHCFTDPMGIRPLFYTEVRGQYFAFASELKALLAIGDPPPQINQRRLAMMGVSALSVYLEWETTCFDQIRRMPAATVMTVQDNVIRKSEYWRPDAGVRLDFTSDSECKEAFQEVFFKAVKGRLRSAFPIGSLLSGGLDSSSIVGAASRILAGDNRNLVTLSSVPMRSAQGYVIDERAFIDLFRNTANLEMHLVPAEGRGPFDDLENLVRTGSLFSYSYQHFLYTAMVREARENGVRVILDGHGGELSASSVPKSYMAELLLAARWKTLIRELRHFEPVQRIRWSPIKSQVLRPLVPYPLLKLLNRHRRIGQLFEYPVCGEFVHDVLGSETDRIRDRVFRLVLESPNHRMNMIQDLQQQQRDARQRSHAGFLDFEHAVFSYPYLDKRVIEFALAVDGRFKYQDGCGRRLLRLGMDGLLPAEIAARTSKAAFSPDYHLRYERDKHQAYRRLREFSESGSLSAVVDFERVFPALKNSPPYHPESPMRADYDSQFLVPWALYLCYFLKSFGAQSPHTD